MQSLQIRSFSTVRPTAARHANPVAVRALFHKGKPGVGENPVEITWNIHARHQEVDDALRRAIVDRLQPVINKLSGGQVREAEGGVEEVDVRLMHTSCHIQLYAVHRNKQVHDTFLRSGVMEAMVTDGDGVWQTFDRAVQQLEHKLKENRNKRPPHKVDYRSKGQM